MHKKHLPHHLLYVTGNLERSLIDTEVWQGAGLCSVAVARCQQTLSNTRAEAVALTQAARHYAKVVSPLPLFINPLKPKGNICCYWNQFYF